MRLNRAYLFQLADPSSQYERIPCSSFVVPAITRHASSVFGFSRNVLVSAPTRFNLSANKFGERQLIRRRRWISSKNNVTEASQHFTLHLKHQAPCCVAQNIPAAVAGSKNEAPSTLAELTPTDLVQRPD